MTTASKLVSDYEFTAMLVHRLVDGLTQEETLIQLPLEVNCLNWVLGHIVTNRSHALEVVSQLWRLKQDKEQPHGIHRSHSPAAAAVRG